MVFTDNYNKLTNGNFGGTGLYSNDYGITTYEPVKCCDGYEAIKFGTFQSDYKYYGGNQILPLIKTTGLSYKSNSSDYDWSITGNVSRGASAYGNLYYSIVNNNTLSPSSLYATGEITGCSITNTSATTGGSIITITNVSQNNVTFNNICFYANWEFCGTDSSTKRSGGPVLLSYHTITSTTVEPNQTVVFVYKHSDIEQV